MVKKNDSYLSKAAHKEVKSQSDALLKAKIKRETPSRNARGRNRNFFEKVSGVKGRGFQQIDNWLLEVIVDKDNFSGEELRIFLWLYRNTIGWPGNKCKLNIPRMVEGTKVSRSWIYKILDKLEENEWIYRKKGYAYMNLYALSQKTEELRNSTTRWDIVKKGLTAEDIEKGDADYFSNIEYEKQSEKREHSDD